jgi:hypothetical protein
VSLLLPITQGQRRGENPKLADVCMARSTLAGDAQGEYWLEGPNSEVLTVSDTLA